jgi:flavin-dependent dehydrogenase
MSHAAGADAQLPVVIGSGLTGLSISHVLSQARIDHLLVGRRPDLSPRLGESLNLEGTLLLWEMFPQLSRFFFPKRDALGFFGDYEVLCDFEVSQRAVSRAIFRTLGYAPAMEFLQVDRIGFDAALWDLATASEHCTVLDAAVADLEFDRASDAFTGVRFENDSTIRPSFVFDATNHGRLLGRTADVACRNLGAPQRVAYTHYHLASGAPSDTEPWELATAVVRLFPDSDGIDGVAWCIPIGSYVSIGISTSATESALDDETLLERTAIAFMRRGIDYRRRYSKRVQVKALRHSYFAYERAWGTNWLLAGPSFCQVWWLAGAGVGTALTAAQLAPKLLDDPQRWGAAYDEYMKQLLPIHDTFDYFALSPREEYEPDALHRFSDRFVITSLVRLAGSTRMRGSRTAATASSAIEWLFKRPSSIQEYCSVRRVDHADTTVVEPPADTAKADVARNGDEALIARLLAVISGDASVADAEDLLAPDVVCHMDRYDVRGTRVWKDWLEFLCRKARGQVKVDLDRFETNPDGTITAFGWLRVEGSPERTPQQNWARYRVDGNRIAEVWTTRANYERIFGAKVRHPLSWFLVLLEMAVWRRLPSGRRARPSRPEESVDGDRNQVRRGGRSDGHPQRRHPDRDRG